VDPPGGTVAAVEQRGTAAGLAQVHRDYCCHTARLRVIPDHRSGGSPGRLETGGGCGARFSEYQNDPLHMSISNVAQFGT
jgi:hypothetical protein